MLGAHLRNENEFEYKLESLCKKFNPEAADAESRLLSVIGDKANLHKVSPETCYEYASADGNSTYDLYCDVWKGLNEQNPCLTQLWYDLGEYMKAGAEMERCGLLLDVKSIRSHIPELELEQSEFLEEFRNSIGDPKFNPNSHVQYKKLLGVDPKKSFDKSELENCGDPNAEKILKYKAYTSVLGKFYAPLMATVSPDGRVYPNIKLHGTRTSRPSCSNPNLLALPKEGDWFNIRSKFLADPGYSFVSFDWSQAELRLLAHYTEDPVLMSIYENDEDLHQQMADIIGISRDYAKRMNLGVVYGLGADGFSKKARIPLERAQEIYAGYHARFPSIKRLYKRCESFADKHGYMTMWTGRRRRFVHRSEHRKAMSALIQGGVGEVMRITMQNMRNITNPDCKMVLQVYDDLMFMVKDDLLEEYIPVLHKEMESCNQFNVKMKSECKVGKTWGTMKLWTGKL
jgi:DNA polymerase-1